MLRYQRNEPADTSTPETSLDDAAAALHQGLLEIKRAYRFQDRDRICCYDISVTQCWAMRELEALQAATLNQLAAALLLDKSTVSRVVDALERKGYLTRRRHPDDGRAILLELTDPGRDLLERIEAELLERERELLTELEPEARAAVVRTLGRLAELASRQLCPAEDSSCGTG